MAQPLRKVPEPSAEIFQTEPILTQSRARAHEAYQILHFAYTVAPLIAGLDKFFHFLVNWDDYLSPIIPQVTGINPHSFMLIVGVIEIVVGIGVWLKPRVFSYVVSVWLLGIIINLITTGQYFDIALRDVGLSLGALALGRLSVSESSI